MLEIFSNWVIGKSVFTILWFETGLAGLQYKIVVNDHKGLKEKIISPNLCVDE